jgi:hypothetical protein
MKKKGNLKEKKEASLFITNAKCFSRYVAGNIFLSLLGET